jgi:hypothetical protein
MNSRRGHVAMVSIVCVAEVPRGGSWTTPPSTPLSLSSLLFPSLTFSSLLFSRLSRLSPPHPLAPFLSLSRTHRHTRTHARTHAHIDTECFYVVAEVALDNRPLSHTRRQTYKYTDRQINRHTNVSARAHAQGPCRRRGRRGSISPGRARSSRRTATTRAPCRAQRCPNR